MALTKAKLEELIDNGDIDVGGGGLSNPMPDTTLIANLNADLLDGVHLADIRLGQNILHNWDFRNPVNQRAVTGTISAGTYAYVYDRWQINGGDATIYIPFLSLSSGSSVIQKIEGAHLAGKTVTGSVMINNVVFSSTPATIGPFWVAFPIAGFGNVVLTHDSGILYVVFENTGGIHADIQAVKLELGTVSTLHLDPPMDHAVELAKCQRFYQRVGGSDVPWAGMGYARCVSGISWRIYIPLPVPMRVTPTLSKFGSIRCDGATAHQITSAGPVESLSRNMVKIQAYSTTYPAAGSFASIDAEGSGGGIELSADL